MAPRFSFFWSCVALLSFFGHDVLVYVIRSLDNCPLSVFPFLPCPPLTERFHNVPLVVLFGLLMSPRHPHPSLIPPHPFLSLSLPPHRYFPSLTSPFISHLFPFTVLSPQCLPSHHCTFIPHLFPPLSHPSIPSHSFMLALPFILFPHLPFFMSLLLSFPLSSFPSLSIN